jgi:hypothetical protein
MPAYSTNNITGTVSSAEVERVYRHITGAERVAHRSPARLEPLQRRVRSLLLEELAHYRRTRRFPKNRDFRHARVPYFVDEQGARCAMAHLLEIGGQFELVRKISNERNHARVRELGNEKDLVVWLAAAGISVEEAARIQPSYCWQTPAWLCFCSEYPRNPALGAAEGVVVQTGNVSAGYQDGVVRVDRMLAGDPGELVVGQEHVAEVKFAPGTTGLVEFRPTAVSRVQYRASFEIKVPEKTVTCADPYADPWVGDFAQSHPVPAEILAQAVAAPDSKSCGAVLGTLDPDWNPPCPTYELGNGGCHLATHAPGAVPALTTSAILFAILSYRVRRRSAQRRA